MTDKPHCEPCPDCGGEGEDDLGACPRCDGHGYVVVKDDAEQPLEPGDK